MTLFKLKSAPILLIEDDINVNTLPLLFALLEDEKNVINFHIYEHQEELWKEAFKNKSNVKVYSEYQDEKYDIYTKIPCTMIVDSVHQMFYSLGSNKFMKLLKRLQGNPCVERIIIILHKDCMAHSSKLRIHMNYIANAVISFDSNNVLKALINIKKGAKFIKTEEIFSLCIKTKTLNLTPVPKETKKDDEPEKPSPEKLSTFKIEVDQTEKLQKYNLKLPYMSKIHEGESKIYYEPDAVDDWDEEDPDDDLDI
ncbi:elongator complex protein 5 [Bombyx mandarina]|uniref:Elongator complex protein 5 n=2 Tax=Bombyx TaxID=7090 RepID=A0A8R1WIN9_BOMMO|nr:elongator complex protein 5 [Bombyx mori]XP_028043306.1 elongator complex protein 5 [Bombyx mandarina]